MAYLESSALRILEPKTIEWLRWLFVVLRNPTSPPSDPTTLCPPSPSTVQPDSSQAPPIQTFPFEELPDEVQLLVLEHALRLHRITLRIDYVLGSKPTIRSLSLVSQKICRMARKVYYTINVVKCIRFRMTALPHNPPGVKEPLNYHFQLPSETVRPWIKHLEMELKISDERLQRFEHERPAQLTAWIWGGALGVLVGPKQGPSARTAWQADLKELRTLRIVLLGDDPEVRELRGVLGAGLENLAIGLQTSSFELEIRHNPGVPAIDHYESDVAIISGAFRTLLGMGEKL